MSPLRKPPLPRERAPSSEPPIVVTYASADDPEWEAAIERWLVSLLDNEVTPGEGGPR